MKKILTKIYYLLNYYWEAKTKYDIHSPFVFEFIKEVLEDNKYYYHFRDIEQLRSQLLRNQSVISVEDFGAGSSVIKSKERKISAIAGSSLTRTSFCQLLFKMIHHYKPQEIVELGTSFGVATLYLSKAAPKSNINTIEGSEKIADVAQMNFDIFKAENITINRGNITAVLPEVLAKIKKLDMIFLDGNHQKLPTIAYFEKSLEYANAQTVFIFDDIYWSEEMAEAWETVKKHPKVRLSIDLYQFGLIFINPDVKEIQHFKILPWYWKPWRMGFLG